MFRLLAYSSSLSSGYAYTIFLKFSFAFHFDSSFFLQSVILHSSFCAAVICHNMDFGACISVCFFATYLLIDTFPYLYTSYGLWHTHDDERPTYC